MFDGPPHEFSFHRDNIKHCESGNKKKYVVGWPIVSRLWPVKTCMILSKEEVLIFKDTRFQLQQKEALSLCQRLSTIATLPIFPCATEFGCLPNFQVVEGSVSQSNNNHDESQKQMRES